ncbi:MAG: 2-phospho-L-lactate transferase [Chloroflexota bacterium]|nr:2-phospho-L-lactate transferase [Chloroflexota bacterium]MDE2686199.1 2-phospho-L-lactate transferase [Chloroflexota bacterium]
MNYLALAGGVGGAKLALGLSRVLPPSDLTVVVNTGDDEEFHGLHVSPDVDTVMYTLAGLSNPETGWGITGETFNALERLNAYGADSWFNLGDKDLATHIRRTHLLRQGEPLSAVTDSLRRALGVAHPIVPMSDDPVRTMLTTTIGELPMQTWFVKHRCEPVVSSIRFAGAEQAQPSLSFTQALRDCDALVFCPSNPFVSVAPILAVPGVRDAIECFDGVRVAVSPIVGGQAIKGPAAKMMGELGIESSCVGVAKQYRGLCDIFVLDDVDADRAPDIEALGMRAAVTNTMMISDDDKVRLAEYICGLAA